MAAEDPDVFDSLFDTSSRMSRLDALIADALRTHLTALLLMAPCSVACDGSASCTGASDRQARERRAKGLPTCHEYRWHASDRP